MTRRLQLLLDEERYERVAAEAKRQRISVAAVIRDAIDRQFAAVALDTKYRTLVSADRGFADVPGLDHVFPDLEGVASLVG